MTGTKWTNDELSKLREMFPNHSAIEIAQVLGRSVESIECKATRLKLQKSSEYIHERAVERGKMSTLLRGDKSWTSEEIKKLVELYPTESNEDLAKIFSCTPKAIRGQAWLLHLRKEPTIRKRLRTYRRPDLWDWSEEEIKKLRAMYDEGKPIHEIAKELGRSIAAIKYRARELSLRLNMPYSTWSLGAKGEHLAEEFFKKAGWTVIEKGKFERRTDSAVPCPASFDFVVETNEGIKYALNVKYGKTAAFTTLNLQRLRNLSFPCALLFITPAKEFFFMPIIPLSME